MNVNQELKKERSSADDEQTEGELPGLPEGEQLPGLPEGEQLPGLPEGERLPGLHEGEERPGLPEEEFPERDLRGGLGRGYQAGYGEGRFEGPFHFGGEHGPVPLVQQLSTSSGLPSHSESEERTTPMFGSSTSGSQQRSSDQRSSESDRQKQSTMDTLTSALVEGPRSQRRSSENEEEEATLERPSVKVTLKGTMTMTLESSGTSTSRELQETLSLPEVVEGNMSVTSNVATGKAKGSKARIVEEKTGTSSSSTGGIGETAGTTPLPSSTTRSMGVKTKAEEEMTAAGFRLMAARERVQDRAQASEVQQDFVNPLAQEIRNPWNQFQHRHKGKGWSMEKMRAEYYKWKNSQQEP